MSKEYSFYFRFSNGSHCCIVTADNIDDHHNNDDANEDDYDSINERWTRTHNKKWSSKT